LRDTVMVLKALLTSPMNESLIVVPFMVRLVTPVCRIRSRIAEAVDDTGWYADERAGTHTHGPAADEEVERALALAWAENLTVVHPLISLVEAATGAADHVS
jgi:hypothetical protein